MITLYESISGDFTFSEVGWEFNWGEESEFPNPIHYNTSLLMDKILQQTIAYKIGGVPCEPDSIFIICNNYPMNAFRLHDAIHHTSYSDAAAETWRDTVQRHGVNHLPDVDGVDNNYFKLDYLISPIGIWEPIGECECNICLCDCVCNRSYPYI